MLNIVSRRKSNIDFLNEKFSHSSPSEIINWAVKNSFNPVLTTSFGKFSSPLIHLANKIKPDIKILWIDSGYNTKNTYEFAYDLINTYKLNIEIFSPLNTRAYRDIYLGQPSPDELLFKKFSYELKVEPLQRAFKKINPDMWITNIRKYSNSYRKKLNIFSINNDGLLKISPFYNYKDEEITKYINSHGLPMNTDYFDPVKYYDKRECGIHLT